MVGKQVVLPLLLLLTALLTFSGCSAAGGARGTPSAAASQSAAASAASVRSDDSAVPDDSDASENAAGPVKLDYFKAQAYSATVTENDTDVYYARKDGIYDYAKASKTVRRLSSFREADSLSVSGRGLFYLSKDNSVLYCLDLDTGKAKKILDLATFKNADGNENVLDLQDYQIADGVVYVSNAGGSVSYDLRTGRTAVLGDDTSVDCSQVVGKTWYYIDHAERSFTIYAYDLSAKKASILLGQGVVKPKSNLYKSFLWVNGALFYCSVMPEGVYRYENGVSRIVGSGSDGWEENFRAYRGNCYSVGYSVEGLEKQAADLSVYSTKYGHMTQVAALTGYDRNTGFTIVDGRVYFNQNKAVTQIDSGYQVRSISDRPASVPLGG